MSCWNATPSSLCLAHGQVLFMGACTKPPDLCILTQYAPRGSLFTLLHRCADGPPSLLVHLATALAVARCGPNPKA